MSAFRISRKGFQFPIRKLTHKDVPPEHVWAGKKIGAAAVILDASGHVLLVKHSYGRLNWELPGGASEPNESASDTAVREVGEETGLLVKAERLTGIYYYPEDDSHHFVFLCLPTANQQEPRSASEETTTCGYFMLDALPRPISDFTVRRIHDALAEAAPKLPVIMGPRRWLE